MPRAVTFIAPHQVDLTEEEQRPPGTGQVLVRALFSDVSAGAELSVYRGTNPYLHVRWDAERRLFAEGRLRVRPLLGHVAPTAPAPEVFRLLEEHPDLLLQGILAFGAERS